MLETLATIVYVMTKVLQILALGILTIFSVLFIVCVLQDVVKNIKERFNG